VLAIAPRNRELAFLFPQISRNLCELGERSFQILHDLGGDDFGRWEIDAFFELYLLARAEPLGSGESDGRAERLIERRKAKESRCRG
jgi:hypothetical protein